MFARRSWFAIFLIALSVAPTTGHSQRVGRDSATRLDRFGRAVAYGAAMSFVYSGVNQINNQPSEWGKGWSGYGKRYASNLGEFVIQESVTDGLAAVMKRPLDYTPCHCTGTGKRIGYALAGAVTDQMPNGRHPIAVPRIVGAYAGAYAPTTWTPDSRSRLNQTLLNGTTSLAIGGLINVYHEFRHR
ncbi:MAG TPA: hypothetical protein VNC18_13335 [Gemmatimonadaceae bacterium]|nr:hypothetical protein [Gemmatimonadaceae bacterium]